MAAQPGVNDLDCGIVKSLVKISSQLTHAEQVNEREAGTATLLSNLRGELSTGLAACSRPRYLRRYVSSCCS